MKKMFGYILKMSVVIFILLLFTSGYTTIEGFDKGESFCKTHSNESCNRLTKKNCNSTSCCVWLKGDTCVAGGAHGPTYNTNDNGKTITHDYYYYQNKCYGPKCPV